MIPSRCSSALLAVGLAIACGPSGDDRRDAATAGADDAAALQCRVARDCGEVTVGEWSECLTASVCAQTGQQSREMRTPSCVDETCDSIVDVQMAACVVDPNGDICEDDGTYCGMPLDCHVCRGGACALNTPHFDRDCSPSCGAAAAACGQPAICCAAGAACAQGTVGPGPWSDCERCCVSSCS